MFVIIPGELISIFSFPGIIVHELSHKLACKKFNVKVLETKYWSLKGGYVVHEATDDAKAVAAISIVPFIIGSLMAVLLGIACVAMKHSELLKNYIWAVYFLAVTIGMHSFPSKQDTSNFLDFAKHAKKKSLIVTASALHYVFSILNALRAAWIDLAYGVLLASFPEKLILLL